MAHEEARSENESRGRKKSRNAFRTISEVSKELDVPQHVLRFWESKFSQIKPMKRGGNRRYYRPEDVDVLKLIRHRLYEDGYTIKGVQKLIKDQGIKATLEEWRGDGDNTPKGEPKSVSASLDALKAEVALNGNGDTEVLKSVLEELKALRASLN